MIALTLAVALFVDPSIGSHQLTRAALTTEPSPVALAAPVPAPMLQSVSVTLEETHPGMGFGAAAIALMRDVTVERSSTDHQFARTIQFMP